MATQLAEMKLTPEENAWWDVERRRHRRIHWLRTGLPWATAYGAGYLLRGGLHDRHHHLWWLFAAGDVVVSIASGAFMAAVTWRSAERSLKLRELRGRRLRLALLSDAEPAAAIGPESMQGLVASAPSDALA